MMTSQNVPIIPHGNNKSRAENLAGRTGMQEREFDNPLYASNSVEAERHSSIPGPQDSGHIYTTPSSPPRSNHYEMEGDDERNGGGGTGAGDVSGP